ncbi:MAG: 50S ribosomal protein L29 [Phycisphaerales bacterium]|jgi:large subunit ribosomal protein L29
MKAEDVRKMKDGEIKQEIGALRTKLFDLRSQTVTEKVEDLSQFGKIRRDLARLMTERRTRQISKGTKK